MPDTAHITPAPTGMSVMELIHSAEALKAGGHGAAAAALYETFVAQNPEHPLLYALLFNLGVILTDNRDLNRARDVMERALEINPDFRVGPFIAWYPIKSAERRQLFADRLTSAGLPF